MPLHTSHYSHLEKPTIPIATRGRLPRIYQVLRVVSITTHTHDRRKSIGEKVAKERKKDKGKERKEKKTKQKRRRREKRRRLEKQEKTRQEEEARQGKKKKHYYGSSGARFS